MDRMEVGEVRDADGKGKHTTTHRELVILPGGGAVIDTPGMREIQVWGDEDGLANWRAVVVVDAERLRARRKARGASALRDGGTEAAGEPREPA